MSGCRWPAKTTYPTFTDASKALRAMRRAARGRRAWSPMEKDKSLGPMEPYRCDGHWHLGHVAKTPKTTRRRR